VSGLFRSSEGRLEQATATDGSHVSTLAASNSGLGGAVVRLDVEKYLARIGFDGTPRATHETLAALQRAHMTAVPFENLDVFFRLHVPTDTGRSIRKIVDGRRGGWCFENNGAFSELLTALGFDVVRLGAAVQLAGPNEEIDHLALQVMLEHPYLVDVGFGESFITPLKLDAAGPQDGCSAVFEIVKGPHGPILTEHKNGGLTELYRFETVSNDMADFDAASRRLQNDPSLTWSQKPFATRLLDGGPDRVTLLADRLKVTQNGLLTVSPVPPRAWEATLRTWFGMGLPDGAHLDPATRP